MLLRLAIPIALGVALGCTTQITEPPIPSEAMSTAPLPQYNLWWRLVERCSGLTGDFGDVAWYVVPGARTIADPNAAGLYFPLSRSIVLAGRDVQSGGLVRHEMLHALIRTSGHPAMYFQDLCGGVVWCDADCALDGGPVTPVDSSGPFVKPADVAIEARVDSTAPSLARDSGWVALSIQVRNPNPYAVRLHLNPVSAGVPFSVAFGYRERTCGSADEADHGIYWASDSVLVLGPSATHRQVFDVRVSSACTAFDPFFSTDTLPTVHVQLVP